MNKEQLKEELSITLKLIEEQIAFELNYIENEDYQLDDVLTMRMRDVLEIERKLEICHRLALSDHG